MNDKTKWIVEHSLRLFSVTTLSPEQAKRSLMQEVESHCCWGKGAARELRVSNIDSHNATHYVLESFGEKRTTDWRSVPYYPGQLVDGPMNGPAPAPWEVNLQPPPPFVDKSLEMEVPHTSSVKVSSVWLPLVVKFQ